MNKIKLNITRTLFHNMYSCEITDSDNNPIGYLRIVPGLPLDKSEIPEDAPEVDSFLLVIVDDADINTQNLINFEETISVSLLERFMTETTKPKYCQFYYPSPAFFFSDKNVSTPPVC